MPPNRSMTPLRRLLLARGACVPALLLGPAAAAQAPYKDATLPVETRVRDLIGRMTVEEKFWQLFMLPGSRADPAQGRREVP